MIAVIAGATGLVGHEVITRLLVDDSIEAVISVGRSSTKIESEKLREVLVKDFADLKAVEDELTGDLYFCCLGTTIKKAGSQENFRKIDHDAIVQFGSVAKNKNARAFVLISASGANSKSNFFYNRVKGDTERDLSEMNLPSLSIFRPGLLMGSRSEFRAGEKIAIGLGALFAAVAPTRISRSVLTYVDRLAEHMIATAKVAKPGLSVIEANEI